jgi:outer membrane receptor protein involved in Fe transport
MIAQHVQRLPFLNSRLVAGASIDQSPQTYRAQFLWYRADPLTGKFTSTSPADQDSLLQHYRTNILNVAAYVNAEITPVKGLKLVAALRYDAFRYDFRNGLDTSRTTVAASGINRFNRVTPKVGFTYRYGTVGIYANYSEGYVPPQLTELYSSGSKLAPYLLPQTFANYEIGGWVSLMNNKFYLDYSLYLMNGTNEIISVKQADNTTINQNAGKTAHAGIEYGISYRPTKAWSFRLSATNAMHRFSEYVVKGVDYSGNEISGAPHFTSNTEITFKPVHLKGLRVSAEWQHQGKYFLDDMNRYEYGGFDVFNLRAGYAIGPFDIWVNALNVLNSYYSTYAAKSAATGSGSYSYNLGDPRELTVGVSYKFGNK